MLHCMPLTHPTTDSSLQLCPCMLCVVYIAVGATVPIVYGPGSLAACTQGSFDAASGLHALGAAPRESCWPLAVPLVLALPRTYSGSEWCHKRNLTIPALTQVCLCWHGKQLCGIGTQSLPLACTSATPTSLHPMPICVCILLPDPVACCDVLSLHGSY